MKRIGIFLGMRPESGGVFQYTESMLGALSALPPSEFEIAVVYVDPVWLDVLRNTRFSAIRPRFADFGLALSKLLRETHLPGFLCRAITRLFNPLARAIVAEHCDLWIFPGNDAINYQAGVQAVVSVHDLMHIHGPRFPEISTWGRGRMRDRALRNTLAQAKAILVDSQIGKQHMEMFCGTRRHPQIIPLPFVAAYHLTDTPLDPGFEERYRIPKKFIFYPAQFWMHKNHINLIDAAALLRGDCPDIHVVFCGSKKGGFEAVMNHIEATGMTAHVTVTGFVPEKDVPEFYRRARALVMPTFFGPTNIPPLEAFALGCPVAMSGIFAMPEQGGDAALYFDPNSPAQIADCVRRLWTDDALCASLRKKGFARTAQWGQPQFNDAVGKIIESLTGSS